MKMELNVYYGGHSISDKGILKLKLKTDYTQQQEVGALYATVTPNLYNLSVDGVEYGNFGIDSIKIDSKFDTTIVLKGLYNNELSPELYNKINYTAEDEMVKVSIELLGGDS